MWYVSVKGGEIEAIRMSGSLGSVQFFFRTSVECSLFTTKCANYVTTPINYTQQVK